MKILYDPDKPTVFVIPEEKAISIGVWSSFRKPGIFLTIIGILLTVAAVAGILGFFDPILKSLF